MEEVEIIPHGKNPTKKVQKIKADVKIDVFTDQQVKQMLTYYQRLKYRHQAFWAYRDYTIIVVLVSTGMRLGELCNLKWNDIDMKNQTITVIGKKRQQSSIPMTDKLRRELNEYRLFVNKAFEKPSDNVFTDRNNNPLTENGVKNMFKRLKKVMNFSDARVSAHTFRHYFAKKMIVAGADAFTVQKMLRHTDLKMTMRYVNLFGTALKQMNDKYNPLNGLDI